MSRSPMRLLIFETLPLLVMLPIDIGSRGRGRVLVA